MTIHERLSAPVRQSFACPCRSRKKLLGFVGAAFLFLASPSYAATLGTGGLEVDRYDAAHHGKSVFIGREAK